MDWKKYDNRSILNDSKFVQLRRELREELNKDVRCRFKEELMSIIYEKTLNPIDNHNIVDKIR